MDPIPLAACAVGSGIGSGLALVTATTIAVDAMRPASGGEPNLGVPFQLLLWGTFAGIALAAGVAWRLLAPVDSAYRRGGLSMVCAFATFLIAVLVCQPVHQVFGRPGLAGLAGLALGAAAVLARRARTAATAP